MISICPDWTMALQLLTLMSEAQSAFILSENAPQEGLQAYLPAFNAALKQCGQQWQQALHLLRSAGQVKLEADVISFNSAMKACEKASAWQMAIAILQGILGRKLSMAR